MYVCMYVADDLSLVINKKNEEEGETKDNMLKTISVKTEREWRSRSNLQVQFQSKFTPTDTFLGSLTFHKKPQLIKIKVVN